MATGFKSGGRKQGTPNRATAARQAAITASGLTPLEFLMSVLRDEKNDPALRFEAAKAAAPYVHPKLAAIQHLDDRSVALEEVSQMSDEELAHEMAADPPAASVTK